MAVTLPEPGTALRPPRREPPAARPSDPAWARSCLLLLLGLTAVLYLWDLGGAGWASDYYAACVQAATHSWKAFFFGSTDATNFATTDTPPAPLWVMALSARLFGFNTWSVLVPQALEGVATVWLLHATVRRWATPAAGLLAGAAFALTPVATQTFRYDRPDALLVLLLVAAAYGVVRATERADVRWLMLAGTCAGFGFLGKLMAAFLVLPALALVYLVAAPTSMRRRLGHLLLAGLALAVSAGWWVAVVALWPPGNRPYIGETRHNSILELIFAANGPGRLTGGGAATVSTSAVGTPGPLRLVGDGLGGQAGWLLPAAVLLFGVLAWRARPGAPRTDRARTALLLWGPWLLLTGVVFSFMQGHFLAAYTAELAPPVAALTGFGVAACWRSRGSRWARLALSATVLTTAVCGCVLLGWTPDWLPWLSPALLGAGIVAAVALFHRPRRFAAATALVVGLAGPLAYCVETVAEPRSGQEPTAGPIDYDTTTVAVPTARLRALLATDAAAYTWTAATVSGPAAASFQLATGDPVLAVGGYFGADPAPTPDDFRHYVQQHRVHYFVVTLPGIGYSAEIAGWVAETFTPTDVDGVRVYDLSRPR